MLCTKCYQKIPEGEEVVKSGSNYFRASWHSGYGTEIYCKKCAKKKDRFDRMFLAIFFSVWGIMMLTGLLVLIFCRRNNTLSRRERSRQQEQEIVEESYGSMHCQTQIQNQLPKKVHELFIETIAWLEKYIEITYKNDFPDWESRKQIHDNPIKRNDIYGHPEKIEEVLSKKLRYFLFEIGEILEGGRQKLRRNTTINSDSPEYVEQLSRVFAAIQVPLDSERNDFQGGKLNLNGNPIYRDTLFNNEEIEEINKALNISRNCLTKGKITDEEINKLCEFELNDKYTLKQLKEVLEEDAHVNESPIISNFTTEYTDFLKTIRDNLSNSLKRIRPKLALIIKEEVEAAVSAHRNRDEARERAETIRKEMNGENPTLCIAPSLQVFYNNSDYLFVNIIKVDLPMNKDVVKNPNKYLLPLDIIERGGGGSSSICHIYADGPSSSGSSSVSSSSSGTTLSGSGSGSATLSSASASEKEKAKVRIDDWETFLTDSPKELIRYRITVPFKKYEKEIEQIAKAVVAEFGKGNYHLIDRNCEHFAFAISCGVNFSEQEQLNRDK
nr:3137_t:CDS:2 [Entrophospora candida]